MPETEARIRFEQVELPTRIPFEIELGDAAEPDALHEVRAERPDVLLGTDLQRRAVTEPNRKGAHLSAGELSRHVTAAVDVDVIALDPVLVAGDQLLDEQRRVVACGLPPYAGELVQGCDLHRLGVAGERSPRFGGQLPGDRLH